MLDCLYQIAKDFQTLIVGMLGFTGVIYTLYTNARLAREQHTRNVAHEREVLIKALRAELGLIKKSFSGKSISLEADREHADAFFPEETHTKVYHAFISKLGLLSPEQASAVIVAYTLVLEVPTRLRLLSSGHDLSFDKPGYIFIQGKYGKAATGIYEAFLPAIEEALYKLEGS